MENVSKKKKKSTQGREGANREGRSDVEAGTEGDRSQKECVATRGTQWIEGKLLVFLQVN